MTLRIQSLEIIGVDVDSATRCAHYHGEQDIIAIKFRCCGKWFSCYECHRALAGHEAEVWPRKEFDEPAILCGGCGHQLTIRRYLECCSVCPHCKRSFNPRCADHYHLYFEMDR